MPALLLLTGPHAGRVHQVDGEVIVGRSPSCTISLDDSKVSRRHAKLVFFASHAVVGDLGSRNGTQLNGERVRDEAAFWPGDRLQIGDSVIVFEGHARARLAPQVSGEGGLLQPFAEVLPAVGTPAALLNAAVSLQAVHSVAQALQVGARVLREGLGADLTACALAGKAGLQSAEVSGADQVTMGPSLVQAALERREVSQLAGALCLPLVSSGGDCFGVAWAERGRPFDDVELELAAAIARLIGGSLSALANRRTGGEPLRCWVGQSVQFRRLNDAIRRASHSEAGVLISGPSGSGLRTTAMLIHHRSARSLNPCVEVDCRHLSAAVDDVLFGAPARGHEAAIESAMLRASGGTLLLHHLESLSFETQVRLAHLLNSGHASAIDGVEMSFKTRVLASTSESREALLERGAVAPELSALLVGPPVEVPPLSARAGDVLLIWQALAEQQSAERRASLARLSPEAEAALLAWHWPGNIAELRHLTLFMNEVFAGRIIESSDLPQALLKADVKSVSKLAIRVSALERELIHNALVASGGKKLQAARLLGISRPTLDKKLNDYRLTVEKPKK